MTDDHRDEPGASVLHLECARFRTALADEDLDGRARQHRRACPDCDRFAREVEETTGLIGEATGPGRVPDDFADRVLRRADLLEGRLADERSRPSAWSGPRAWIAAAVALTVALAFWAGDMSGRSRHDASPARPVATSPATQAPPTLQAAPDLHAADAGEAAPRPVRLMPRPTPPTPTARPVVPAAQPIPEPSLDVPEELRRSLLRAVERGERCPAEAGGSVRVTVTIQPDGTLTDRQILSLGEAGEAHRCVSRALDHLLLPPLEESVTVTLDVTW